MTHHLAKLVCATALIAAAGCGGQVCSGDPEPCNYMTMADQCDFSAGCQSSARGYCITLGAMTSDTCEFDSNQTVCALDAAQCVWTGGMCAARSGCGAHTTYDTCEADPACGWSVADCTGTPQPCSSHSEKNSCLNQIGCTWES